MDAMIALPGLQLDECPDSLRPQQFCMVSASLIVGDTQDLALKGLSRCNLIG
jgi:hypothetical protein